MRLSRRSVWLWALFAAAILSATACPASAAEPGNKASTKREAELGKEMAAALDQLAKGHQKSGAVEALQGKKTAAPTTGIVATIAQLAPCMVCVSGPVEIVVEGEMGVGANEPRPRLFILYIVLRNCNTGEYFLKSAQSIRLSPGSGVGFLPVEHVYGATPGVYQLAAQVRTANPDGSETIHATKTCRFVKVAKTGAKYATIATSLAPLDPLPKGEAIESWMSQPIGVARRYVHYVAEDRIWLLVDGDWREYVTDDPAIKQLIQDAFGASNGFIVTVWYTGKKADHVQIARTANP